MDNVTSPIATVSVRIFGSVTYTLLSAMGLTLNILLIIIFLQSKTTFRRNAFYTIAWQLIVCDILTHCMEFIVPIPLTFAGRQIYGDSLVRGIPCFIDTIVYNGTLFFSFLMTVNRFTVFITPRLNAILFQKLGLYLTIGFMWLFVILFIVGINVFACYKTFESNGFYYYHVCPPWDDIPLFGQILKNFSAYASTYLPVAMFITYIFMIVYIKMKLHFEWKNGHMSRRVSTVHNTDHGISWKTEFSLLAQSFVICAFIEVQNLVFEFLPTIPATGQWTFIINIVGNWVSLLLSSIHPIVLFTFNKNIRKRLKYLLRKIFRPHSTKVMKMTSSSFIVSTSRIS